MKKEINAQFTNHRLSHSDADHGKSKRAPDEEFQMQSEDALNSLDGKYSKQAPHSLTI